MPDFSHVGVRGVWLNVQREFRPGKKFPQVFPKSLIFAIYRRCASPHHSLASPAKRTLTTRATFPDLSKPRRSSSSEGSAERTGSEPNKVSCQRQQ